MVKKAKTREGTRSQAMKALDEAVGDLHRAGGIDKPTMRRFNVGRKTTGGGKLRSAITETARGLHKIGAISDAELEEIVADTAPRRTAKKKGAVTRRDR